MISVKKFTKRIAAFVLSLMLVLCSCGCADKGCRHKDDDNNGVCDSCYGSVFVYFDFYAVGDAAGKQFNSVKIADYFKVAKQKDENTVILSTGNMHKSADNTATAWMNELQFSASALGVNDFELGEDFIDDVAEHSNFSLLAINIYDSEDNRIADFCSPSMVVEEDNIKIGIIGAVGDFYNQISSQNDDVYFKTGNELTQLVKDEATRLRNDGADFVVYLLNGGNAAELSYDLSLSEGYVDIVFESNTSESYATKDAQGVYHLQNNAKDTVGISHAEVAFNVVTDKTEVRTTNLVYDDVYTSVEYVPEEPSNDSSNNTDTSSKDGTVDNDKNNNSTNDDKPQNNNSNGEDNGCTTHKDANGDEICDICAQSVIVLIDFYNINDLHGKLADTDDHIGVDELTTYLKNARNTDDNVLFLSTGDMWQGQAESNSTKGLIMTDWMNELDFTAMAIGNHEFDWGEEYIENNADAAEFPFLAINIYDRATDKLVDYCEPSVVVDMGDVQVGVIGAIGDCYSSISSEKCKDVYFKVGNQLTSLIKAEADRLRSTGVDFIVYILHDGYGSSNTGSVQQISSSKISSYYDVALSDGYVDLVFEGHTHQGYRLQDQYGVYHVQNRGDNKGGISHAEIAINSITNKYSVNEVELVSTSQYQNLADDPIVENLLQKYDEQVSTNNEILGYNKSYRDDEYLEQLVAKLYYEAGEKMWGSKYKIVLGGGFLRTRAPYNLAAGDVTYGQLSSLFTFDNQLTLCSVKGRDLRRKFIETDNEDYFIHYGDYGNSIRNKIDDNATYYIVVDDYTATYKYNNLTIVEKYTPNVFARDLLAEYVRKGGLN